MANTEKLKEELEILGFKISFIQESNATLLARSAKDAMLDFYE